MEINRSAAPNCDSVKGITTLFYGGTLSIVNLGPDLQAGDTFTLFTAQTYYGGFTNVSLPALASNLTWHTNNLAQNGSISVSNVIVPTLCPCISWPAAGRARTRRRCWPRVWGSAPGATPWPMGWSPSLTRRTGCAVPTLTVTDPTVINSLLAGSDNQYPSIPLSIQQLDLTTLSNLTMMPNANATSFFDGLLSSAGLTPLYGSPAASHTAFCLNYTNTSGSPVSNSYALDTTVSYTFQDPSGYPLVGPGAQVQVAFGAARLTHPPACFTRPGNYRPARR